MQKILHGLESLKQVRYQLIAYDCIGHLLLDLGLNELAVEHLERGLALSDDTGIQYWRAAIDAHLTVARTRLGQQDVTAALQATLEQTRSSSERYMLVRCLDALAEIALTAGDTKRCRGESLLAEKDYAKAQTELSRAAALAESIGRIRLQMNAEAALARLFAAQGQKDATKPHKAKASAIAEAIEKSLESSGLQAQISIS